MRTHGEYTYCKCDALHPSVTPSDWFSKDWDGNKAKAREQCPLLNFKLLEQQIQKTLQDRAKDTPQETTHNVMAGKQETDFINGIQDLMLESRLDTQISADVLAPLLGMPGEQCKGDNRKMNQQQHQHMR